MPKTHQPSAAPATREATHAAWLQSSKPARDAARQALRDAGFTIKEWAEANGFDHRAVVDVLHGRRAGHYKEAHRVAVALGIKSGRLVQAKGFKPGAAPAP